LIIALKATNSTSSQMNLKITMVLKNNNITALKENIIHTCPCKLHI